MATTTSSWLAAVCLGSWACAGWAAVETEFVAPENYRDTVANGDWANASADNPTLVELAKHLEMLGKRYLAADQVLRIKVLDIDLAGERRPVGRHLEVMRVLNSVTWPRIRLSYALERGGKVEASGEDTIADMNYLNQINPYYGSDPLRYEKLMMERWFVKKFGPH